MRVLARSVAELQYLRIQVQTKTELVAQYKTKVGILVPQLAAQQETNKALTEQLNQSQAQQQRMARNKWWYIIGGAAGGALVYAILAR